MALNFPNSPTVGQIYTDTTSGFSYEWDGTVWKSYSPTSSSQIRIIDDISGSFNGIVKTFALTVGGVSLTPANSQSLIITVGGVLQEPGVDYNVSTTNIVFDEAPEAALSFSGVSLGPAVPVTTIPDGTTTDGAFNVVGLLSAANLYVAGVSTFVGLATHTGTIFGSNLSLTGVATASSFSGNASSATYATSAGLSTNVKGTGSRVLYNSSTDTTTTSANLTFDGTTLAVNSTPGANTSALSLTGVPFGSNTKNGILGIGTLGFTDSNLIANFTDNVNSYAQVIIQNLNSGNAASADFVVNSDSPLGQIYYGDFGINGTAYNGGGPFGDTSGTYLYSKGGTLAVGTDDAQDFRIATGSGPATPVTRVTVTGIGGSVGIGITNPTTTLQVQGSATAFDTRFQSVGEKSTRIDGNTASLVYNTGGGNIAICTNATGNITLAVTGIPTDGSFDNTAITFSVCSLNTGTARSCTAVTLNGLSATIRWSGGSFSNAVSGVTTTSGMDIYSFTGINTVGSASTTANYYLLGVVNGGYR